MNLKTIALFILGALAVIALVMYDRKPETAQVVTPAVTTTSTTATSSAPAPVAPKATTTPVKPQPRPEAKPSTSEAAQLLVLTNADRVSNGLKPLAYNALVEKAAVGRAGEIAASGYFSHTSADDSQYRMRYWLDSVGAQWSYGGENLAEGFSTMQEAESAFLASPTHRANILKPEYTQIGIATAQGVCQNAASCGTQLGKQTTFLVVIFTSIPN